MKDTEIMTALENMMSGEPGVVYARLLPSKNKRKLSRGQKPHNWVLPVWIQPTPSSTWRMAYPPEQYGHALLHGRIGRALGIESGDSLVWEELDEGNRFCTPVTLVENDQVDFVIDIRHAGGMKVKGSRSYLHDTEVFLQNGDKLTLQHQFMFTPLKVNDPRGGAILHISGVAHDSADGKQTEAGLGFCIHSSIDTSHCHEINELVMGYRYLGFKSRYQAIYVSLLEGLLWAARLDAKKLWICTDADFLIEHLTGEVDQLDDQSLTTSYRRCICLLDEFVEGGTDIEFRSILEVSNTEATDLANRAVEEVKSAVICQWDNLNKQLRRNDDRLK